MRKSLWFWTLAGVLLAGVPVWLKERANLRDARSHLAMESLRYAEKHRDALVEQTLEQFTEASAARRDLGALRGSVRELGERIAGLSEDLGAEARRAQAQEHQVQALASATGEKLDARIGACIAELKSEFKHHLGDLRATLAHELKEVRARDARLERESRSETDRSAMIAQMVLPVARLSGATTVGSGIILASLADEKKGKKGARSYSNYLLTSYHVVRDILLEGDEKHPAEIRATLFEEGGTISSTGELLAFDEEHDLALLLLSLRTRWRYPARLVEPAIEHSTQRFTPVYAVGCPLGNKPVATRGEVISREHEVAGQHYWMISAPSYFGNSGGGVFLARSHAMVGIFSKIYTHGRTFPTVITHMGLLTPAATIRRWLHEEGYDNLLE